MENIQTGKRGLFFLEMDMATERIVSDITRDNRVTLFYKLSQYDRYLQGMRYSGNLSGVRRFPVLYASFCHAQSRNELTISERKCKPFQPSLPNTTVLRLSRMR